MTPQTQALQKLISNWDGRDHIKRTAMLLAQDGADLTVYGTTPPFNTLLHCLVLTNKDGINDNEITELLKKDTANAKTAGNHTALASLLGQLTSKQCSMDDFKRTAMLLAKGGADLTVYGSTRPHNTLLLCLVDTNKDGVNDKEITELLRLKQLTVASITFVLSSLIQDLTKKRCSMTDFKRTAMLLVQGSADFATPALMYPYNTLLHCLVLDNEQEMHDKEINELLKLNSDIFNIANGKGLLPLQALLIQQPQISINAIIKLITLGNALHYKNFNGENLLHTACYVGNLELVQYLASNGLDISAKTLSGTTTLFLSARTHNRALWNYLYEHHVDINAQEVGECKRTALHRAIEIDNIEMVQWLIEHNADLNIAGIFNKTALHLAIEGNKKTIVEWLIKNNANLNAQDDKKQTALHLATLRNNKAIVQLLIEHNADLFVKNEYGETALSISQKRGTKEITELLLTNQKYLLFATLDSLEEYGNLLKIQGASKGQIAIDLAAALKLKADIFFKKGAMPSELKAFQEEFSLLLNSKNKEMAEYRTSWSTITANIAIALTGIGALLLVGQLIYTQATQGRALFFLQKNQTTSEEKIDEVRQAMFSLGKN